MPSKIHLLRMGVTPMFKTPYGVFCILKGGTDKVCSL